MNRLTENKIVLISRQTRLDELIARFNTVAQARFYIERQGADFSDYQSEAECYADALQAAQTILSRLGRVQMVDRKFLPNFLFGPDDTVVTLGQDGLVANTLKYLNGQPVIAANPDPGRWDGQLLPFRVDDLEHVTAEVFRGARQSKSITMAQATLNNGESIFAVNDLFIGPKSHTSVRYKIQMDAVAENQSSSGIIVSTGLGSTGWFKSLLTGAHAIAESDVRAAQKRKKPVNQATPFPWDSDHLFFTVREPFPSRTTQASIVFGKIPVGQELVITSATAENAVIFSDGIEKDFLDFNSGTRAVITVAERKGRLII